MKRIIFIWVLLLGLSAHAGTQSHSTVRGIPIEKEYNAALQMIKREKYSQALNILEKALKSKEFKKTDCKLQSMFYNQTGVSYYYQNKIIKAFKIWKEKTLPVLNKCDSADLKLKAQVLYNIGYCYMQFDNFDKAIQYKEKAFNLVDSLGLLYKDPKYAFWSDNLYFSYNRLGDFNKAEGYAFKTLTILDSLHYKDTIYISEIYRKIALNFIDKNELDLAKQYLDIAYKMIKNKETKRLFLIILSFEKLHRAKKEPLKEKKLLDKAWKLYNNYHKNNKKLYEILQETEGLYNVEINQNKKALRNFFNALKILKSIKAEKPKLSNIYENIAGAYGRLGMIDSALYYMDKSINLTHNLDKNKISDEYRELLNNDFSKRDMIRKLQMKGKFLNKRYEQSGDIADLLRSESVFAKADTLVFQLRREIKNKDSKIIIGIALDTVYSYAIDNVYKLWELTGDTTYLKRAYYYTSENKAVVFTEIKEELNAVWNILPEKLRNRYLYITGELKSNLYLRQYAVLKKDTLSYQRLNSEYISLSAEKEKLLKRIKYNYPKFYQSIEEVLIPKSLDELQLALEEDNAILEYYVDGNILYSFLITKDYFDGIKQKLDFNLDSIFLIFNRKLSNIYNDTGFVALSKRLYPILFPLTVREILDKKNIHRLVVIRDKNMNLITFGPLLKGSNIKKDLLINIYAFSYLYNNKYIKSTYNIKEEKEFEFGGFATNYDEETLKDISHDTMYWSQSTPPVLSPLKQSINEINSISKLFHSEKWLGKDCTVENFKANAHKYDIIHLSLHSIIAADNNEQSAMIFQKIDNKHSYILKSSDIIGLHINNSLTVLSSCFTSKGDVISGEGMKSLARNFAIAGSPAIIASQWQAYEGQTKYILTYFYKNLKKGYPKDVAMQKAKLKYIAEAGSRFSAPANWANLMVIGDVSIVEFKWWHHVTIIQILAFLYLLLLAIILIKVLLSNKTRER